MTFFLGSMFLSWLGPGSWCSTVARAPETACNGGHWVGEWKGFWAEVEKYQPCPPWGGGGKARARHTAPLHSGDLPECCSSEMGSIHRNLGPRRPRCCVLCCWGCVLQLVGRGLLWKNKHTHTYNRNDKPQRVTSIKPVVLDLWVSIPLGVNHPFTRVI